MHVLHIMVIIQNNNVKALSFFVKFNENDLYLTFSKGMGMNE
jgi:hypothetical protein